MHVFLDKIHMLFCQNEYFYDLKNSGFNNKCCYCYSLKKLVVPLLSHKDHSVRKSKTQE